MGGSRKGTDGQGRTRAEMLWLEGARQLREEGRLAWLLGRGLQEALEAAGSDVPNDREAVAARLGVWVKEAVSGRLDAGTVAASTFERRAASEPTAPGAARKEKRTDPASKWSELVGRRLDDRGYPVVFVGARRIRGRWAGLALGVDLNGKKHVLGGRDDADMAELVGELARRGLQADGGLLVVSDGSPAVDDAVRRAWSGRVRVQHCLYQLRHDLRGHTPDAVHGRIEEALLAAGHLPYPQARSRLEELAALLGDDHPGARVRLERSLEGALTVARLGVSALLRKHLQIQGMIRVACEQAIALGKPGAAGLEALASGVGAWLSVTRRFFALEELPDLAERLRRSGQEP